MKKVSHYFIFVLCLLILTPGQSKAEIDVLVVYTPAALEKADNTDILRWGEDAINAKIDFMISEANLIFTNSQLDTRLRLVGRRMVDHDESKDLHNELNKLADKNYFSPTNFQGYNLELLSVTTTDNLPDSGWGTVIIALVGTKLHIRIFDINGKRIINRAENELINGENLTALKQRLNPFPVENNLSDDDKSEILEYTRLVAYPMDGDMDIVHTWRNAVGADVVNLITATSGGKVGGVAPGIYKDDGFADYKGFSVNDLSFSYVDLPLFYQNIGMLFTHEFGHLLGCHHYQWELKPPSGPGVLFQPYAYAHKFKAGLVLQGTIMATPDDLGFSYPIRYFSNPNVSYLWVPTGVDKKADNAKMIRESTPWVEGYRAKVILDDDIWVDTAYVGYGQGTLQQPYSTVLNGINSVPYGGNLRFVAGNENWTGTISNPMTMISHYGAMVIGR